MIGSGSTYDTFPDNFAVPDTKLSSFSIDNRKLVFPDPISPITVINSPA
jgi:hypothetical protein